MVSGKHAQVLRTCKQLLIAVLVTCLSSVAPCNPAQAQTVPLGLGIYLGQSLLYAAARHRPGSSSSSSDPSRAAGSNSRNRKQAVSYYNKGVRLFNSKKYDEAISMLTQCVQTDPQMANGYALLGACQSRAGQSSIAIQNFQIAQNGGANFKSLQYEMGMCAARLGDYQYASYCFQQHLARNSNDELAPEAAKALSIIQHNCGGQTNDDYLSDASKAGARRWADSQMLRVYIQQGCVARGYRPEFVGIVQQAFDDWSRGTNGKIGFVFVADPSQAQIKVSWTDNEADLGGPDAKELGVTATVVASGVIESADIKLLTLDTYCRNDVHEIFPQAKCVALHEIGHALGLQHSSQPFDTMFPLVPPKGLEFNLTRRDLNTMVALYSQNAGNNVSLFAPGAMPFSESSAQQGK